MNNYHPLLIVDDDPEERYLMHLALSDIGWGKEVLFFHSAEACLHHLALLPQAQYPSLLLLDYHMPGINGGMLLDLLKESWSFRDLPVLIYSTHLSPGLKEELMDKGARNCYHKVQNYSEAIAFAKQLQTMCALGLQPSQGEIT